MMGRWWVVCAVAVVLSACAVAENSSDTQPAEVATTGRAPEKAPLPHTPLEISEIEGRAFQVKAEGSPIDEIRFTDGRTFARFKDGSEVSRGEYVLTPDGRLCLVTDGSADSSCWRRLPGETAGGAIALQVNAQPRDVLLVPLASSAGETP